MLHLFTEWSTLKMWGLPRLPSPSETHACRTTSFATGNTPIPVEQREEKVVRAAPQRRNLPILSQNVSLPSFR